MAGEWNVRANILVRAILRLKGARPTPPLPDASPEERAAYSQAISHARRQFAWTLFALLAVETSDTILTPGAPLAAVLAVAGLFGLSLATATGIVLGVSVILGYLWWVQALRAEGSRAEWPEVAAAAITMLPGTLISNAITVVPPIVVAWLLMRVSGLGLLTSAGTVVGGWLVLKLARYIPVFLSRLS